MTPHQPILQQGGAADKPPPLRALGTRHFGHHMTHRYDARQATGEANGIAVEYRQIAGAVRSSFLNFIYTIVIRRMRE